MVAAVLLAAPLGAQAERPAVPSHAVQEGAVALSLEQVIEMALRNNLDIAVSRYDAQKAANDVIAEEGAFDPLLTSSLFNQERTSPTGDELQGAAIRQDETQSYSVGISQELSYGASWSATTSANRFSTNSEFQQLNPSFSTNLELRYNQPLLRNFGRDAGAYTLRLARNNRSISAEAFREQVLSVVETAISAYWDLVFSIEDLAVKERSLELGLDLQRQNEIMVEVGTLAPIEITVAEAEVASRREAIITARSVLEDAEDTLLQILNADPRSELWDSPIYPIDLPVFESVEVDVDRAYAAALENRPEIRQTERELENAQLSMRFQKDQLRPQLDLELSLAYNGLAGDRYEIVDLDGDPTTTDDRVRTLADTGSVGDSFDQVIDADFDTWSVALNFSYPIGNKAAKSRLANARLDYEQSLARLERLRDSLRVEVRRAVRNLRSSRERVEAAGVTRKLREEQLDAERKKFDEGLTTNYEVLQFQRDLEAARTGETQAVVDYSKAVVELKRITGDLLQDLGVQLVLPTSTVR